jgi:hypothetical protein
MRVGVSEKEREVMFWQGEVRGNKVRATIRGLKMMIVQNKTPAKRAAMRLSFIRNLIPSIILKEESNE